MRYPYLYSDIYSNEFFIGQEPPCWYGHTTGASVTPFYVNQELEKISGREVTREIFGYNISLFFRSGRQHMYQSNTLDLFVSAYGERWTFEREEINKLIKRPLTDKEKIFLLKELGEYYHFCSGRMVFKAHTPATVERVGEKYFFLDVFPGHEVRWHWKSGWERGNRVIIRENSEARIYPPIEGISTVPFVEGLGTELRYIDSMSEADKKKYGVK